ncbi:MAG: GTPase Era [Bacteroidales bacterium]|nr:GTPase Era [Lentimicrobiaceae bacterium]MDD5693711.1 GTPase Era [Bacteroidales bacterium]
MAHKSGFINIIGNPNTGKSTLMNAMVGEKLSIITSKAQTTRHRIMGIVNGDNFQMVYSDTPGIIKPHYKLHQSMMKYIETALIDADIILYVTQVDEKTYEPEIFQAIHQSGIPVIVLINKIDLSDQVTVLMKITEMKRHFPQAEIFPVSALLKFNLDTVFDAILEKLPVAPPYYPKDELTDRSVRFFVSEIIREKILLNYHQEIPYSAEVVIDHFKEKDQITVIGASILMGRESQKAIIIGNKGQALKKLGIEARKEIEAFLGVKVFLELSVKVRAEWRDDDIQLKRFGYEV